MDNQNSIIHPVVILEIIKEFHGGNAENGDKIGSIMGYYKKNYIFCTSAFNIPFEKKKNKVWFLDQIYLEKMAYMNRKINSKENIVGWFSMKKNIDFTDWYIHDIFFGYTHNPILLHIWASRDVNGLILDIFKKNQKNILGDVRFENIPVKIGLLESEEIAVNEILINSKNSPNLINYNVEKKWYQFVIFFSRFVKIEFKKKIDNIKTNDIKIFKSNYFNLLQFFNPFILKKINLGQEKGNISFFLSSFIRYISSIENFIYLNLTKKI